MGKGTGDGMTNNTQDGDSMGKGAGDGMTDNTQDGPTDNALNTGMDKAHDEGADVKGDVDG